MLHASATRHRRQNPHIVQRIRKSAAIIAISRSLASPSHLPNKLQDRYTQKRVHKLTQREASGSTSDAPLSVLFFIFPSATQGQAFCRPFCFFFAVLFLIYGRKSAPLWVCSSPVLSLSPFPEPSQRLPPGTTARENQLLLSCSPVAPMHGSHASAGCTSSSYSAEVISRCSNG